MKHLKVLLLFVVCNSACGVEENGGIAILSAIQFNADLSRVHQVELDDGDEQILGLFINTSHFTAWNELENEVLMIPDEESMERIWVRGVRCPESCRDGESWTSLGEASGSLVVGPNRSSFHEIAIAFAKTDSTPATTIKLDKLEFNSD